MRSLARKTGLSVATISRVLNDSGHVSESTRLRVKQAIQESGYVPNSAARALSTQRTRTIGAVLPTLADSIFSRFIDSLEDQLAQYGYALVVATTQYDPDKEAMRARELLDMGAEGLVLSGAQQNQDLLSLLKRAAIPAVCSSLHEAENGLTAIGYDNAAIAEQAIEYLHAQGHKRIAIAHGPSDNNDRTLLRIKGVKQAAQRLGVTLSFQETALDTRGGSTAAKRLLHNPFHFSAILCLSDVIAMGMLFEAHNRHIAIPETLSIMGFDDLPWTELCHPPLTTIRLPTGRMGRAVADALIERLEHDRKMECRTLTANIVERCSTAKAMG
ncbi:MAG: LacI family DNA-binding transcriptional regulator [Granulosicoccus sp.]